LPSTKALINDEPFHFLLINPLEINKESALLLKKLLIVFARRDILFIVGSLLGDSYRESTT